MSEERKDSPLSALITVIALVVFAGFLFWRIERRSKEFSAQQAQVATTVTTTAPAKVEMVPVDPIIQRLADYAKKRGIRWRIICDSTDTEERYLGWAVPQGGVFEVYIEDGGGASWATEDHATQKGAASELYYILQHGPNIAPRHRPKQDEKTRASTNVDASGEVYQNPLKCMRDITSENVGQKCEACDAIVRK